MDRLACVNAAALPLQLLLGRHPEWARLPVAVVEDDRPQAPVLFLNARAYRAGVRSGQRYATALSLAPGLRGGTISRSRIEHGVSAIADRLRRYSPHVEPATDTPGVFWLDAQGLDRLYPSLEDWAGRIRAELLGAGITAAVAVGFSRFGVHALALAHGGTLVCTDLADERARVDAVPLSRLALEPDVRDRLLALGIDTVGAFLRLPGDGIRTRFGAAADALHRLASGTRWAPLVAVPAEERHEPSIEFDAPERDVERLVFVMKRLLDGLVAALAHRHQSVVELAVSIALDDRTMRVERVRPAAPTLDVAQLLALARLRLDTLRLPAGIVGLRVTAGTCPATPDQCRLFQESRRDAGAADRALARVRAECGEHSVVRARLCDAHLPAARFAWEPFDRVPARAAPRFTAARPLVRRIYTTPLPLGPAFSKPAHERPDRHDAGPAVVGGRYIVSGGWWGGPPGGVHREYFFARTPAGDLWWVYYDRRRRGFFLQGLVE